MKNNTQNSIIKVKVLALIVFILIAANSFAAHGRGSSLRLLLPTNGEHNILIDNIAYKGVNGNFKIDNLNAGNHRLKIVQLIFSRRGFVVNKIILFNGMVFVPRNAKVWASVTNNGRFVVERIYQFDNYGGRGNYYDGNRNGNHGNGNYNRGGGYNNNNGGSGNRNGRTYNDYYDDDWYSYEDNSNGNRDGNSQGNGGYSDNNSSQGNSNRNNNSNVGNNRSKETFALTLDAIKKQSFDTERLKIAKNAVVSGQMLSSEVAEITKLFSFESSRLEFAKYAYNYTVDKQNYVIVQDAFQFSSSTSELQDYIAQVNGK